MSTKTKNNKTYLTEDTLIFENSGVKIITGVSEDDLGTTIKDMTLNPGDMVITSEGNLNVLKPNNTFLDLSEPSAGGDSGVTKQKFTFDYTDFAGLGGTVGTLPLFSLPAKAVLEELVIYPTVRFENGAASDDTVNLFILEPGGNILQASVSPVEVNGTTVNRNNGGVLLNMESSSAIEVQLESDDGMGANLASLTAGEVEIYIEYKLLAE